MTNESAVRSSNAHSAYSAGPGAADPNAIGSTAIHPDTAGAVPHVLEQLQQSANGAARDIALAFGVPPMLLGIRGDNTYANYVEANRAFYRLIEAANALRRGQPVPETLIPINGRVV